MGSIARATAYRNEFRHECTHMVDSREQREYLPHQCLPLKKMGGHRYFRHCASCTPRRIVEHRAALRPYVTLMAWHKPALGHTGSNLRHIIYSGGLHVAPACGKRGTGYDEASEVGIIQLEHLYTEGCPAIGAAFRYFIIVAVCSECLCLLGLGHLGALAVTVSCVFTEFFLDAEELVVLGHTVAAACRTGLNLSGVGSNCDVGDSSVLCLA